MRRRKEEGIRVDGWNVKATQMEIMAGKFDARSSSLTIILVAIQYFRVGALFSFWSLKNNKGGHYIFPLLKKPVEQLPNV